MSQLIHQFDANITFSQVKRLLAAASLNASQTNGSSTQSSDAMVAENLSLKFVPLSDGS